MKYIKDYALIITMGLAVILSGGTLMVVSQNVYETQRAIQEMDREAMMTEWEIRALNAELAFLTRPERLEQIASAITYSISPSMGDDILVVSPVSLSSMMPSPSRGDNIILPDRKPAVSYQRVSAPIPSRPQQTTSSQDFSSLLNSIGGSE